MSAQVTVLEGKALTAVNYHGIAPDMTSWVPATAVVGPGVELPAFGVSVWVSGQPQPGFMSIDDSNTAIRITANVDQPFGDVEVVPFLDTDEVIPPFAGVTIDPATNWNGFDASDLYVAPNGSYFQVNLTALHALAGQQIVLDVVAEGITCQEDLGLGGPGEAAHSVCGGNLSTGTTADLHLTGAPALAPALLLAGLASAEFPFKGGTLVPVPWLVEFPLQTDPAGTVTISGIPGGGGPVSFYLQAVLVDPAQPLGVGLSNAVRIDLLP